MKTVKLFGNRAFMRLFIAIFTLGMFSLMFEGCGGSKSPRASSPQHGKKRGPVLQKANGWMGGPQVR